MFVNKMILATLSLYSLASAFTIPEGHGDGLYLATVHKDGNVTHEQVDTAGKRDLSAGIVHVRQRDTFQVSRRGCTGGFVTQYDWASATGALAKACDPAITIANKQHAYAISGGAVAFMCNYGGDNPCAAGELHQALASVGQICLHYQAGWALSDSWAKSYGYDTTMGSICTNE